MDLKSILENLAGDRGDYKNITTATASVWILIFFIGLGVGLLIKPHNQAPITIDRNIKIGLPSKSNINGEAAGYSKQQAQFPNTGNFVASINGKSYYPKDCPSAKRIKEENKIWFNSAEEAETQGYKAAQNCP